MKTADELRHEAANHYDANSKAKTHDSTRD